MFIEQLPCCTLFYNTGDGWKIDRGGQSMIWETGSKTPTNAVIRVGTIRQPDCGP